MEPYVHLQDQPDESLCALAACGDRTAEECLVTRYTRLVRQCARPYFLAGGDREDLIQEGMIGLLSAIRGFDASRGARFRTYAEVCVHHRLLSAMKAAARIKHMPLNSSISLRDTQFDREANPCSSGTDRQRSENPEDMLIHREERQQRMSALRRQLSRFERTVLALYLDGLSYGEIGLRLGKSPKSVDNAVQRVRRKVAPFLISGDISAS